jgi:hypothetical protein
VNAVGRADKIQMRCVRLQPALSLPLDLHVHHPGLHEVCCVSACGNYAGPLCGRGRHGDRVHTDVQEPWRAPCSYCTCWDCYGFPAGSVLAILLRREDQRRQQEDRLSVAGLKRVEPLPSSAHKVREQNVF